MQEANIHGFDTLNERVWQEHIDDWTEIQEVQDYSSARCLLKFYILKSAIIADHKQRSSRLEM